jgi:hypothetical protein
MIITFGFLTGSTACISLGVTNGSKVRIGMVFLMIQKFNFRKYSVFFALLLLNLLQERRFLSLCLANLGQTQVKYVDIVA